MATAVVPQTRFASRRRCRFREVIETLADRTQAAAKRVSNDPGHRHRTAWHAENQRILAFVSREPFGRSAAASSQFLKRIIASADFRANTRGTQCSG